MRVIKRKNARTGVNGIRSQSRESTDPNRERPVEIGFMDTDNAYKMKRDKVDKFSTSG